MNNDNIIVFCVLSFIGSICLHKCIRIIVEYIVNRNRSQEYSSAITSTKDLLCKGPHSWDNTTLVLSKIPIGSYKVCTSCGVIVYNGLQYCLNQPGLEVYKNNIKRRNARVLRREDALKRKQNEADEIMNRMIRLYVGKLGLDLHENIEIFQQFFRKSNIELDEMYDRLNKQLYDEDNHG